MGTKILKEKSRMTQVDALAKVGEYEYQVGRFTDESYKSKIYKTKGASNSDVAANGFTFIQETDQ